MARRRLLVALLGALAVCATLAYASVITTGTISTTPLPVHTGSPQWDTLYLFVESGAIRWRDDGTLPTTTTGFLVATNGYFILQGSNNLTRFRMIRSGGTDAVVTWRLE